MKQFIWFRILQRAGVSFSILLLISGSISILLSVESEAATISLKGSAKLQSSLDAESLNLTISYSIANNGDEKAYFVEPHFQLGAWEMRGQRNHIESKRSANWRVAVRIPLSDLRCPQAPRCVGQDLPLNGTHPLLITNGYQDKNEKEFSAIEVWNIAIGNIDESILKDLRKPPLDAHFKANRDPGYFKGIIKVKNNSSEALRFAVTYFLPREFEATSKNDSLGLAPGAEGNYRFHYENKDALKGSSYATYALLQANYKGVRMSFPLATQTVLLPPARLHKGILFTMISMVLGLLLVVFYVFREDESSAG